MRAAHNARQWLQSMDAVAPAVPDVWSDCTAGLVAGACAAALTTPLDVLVTHTATAHSEGSSRRGGSRTSSSRGSSSSGRRSGGGGGGDEQFALWETVVEPLRVGARLVECEGPGSLVKGIGCRTLYYAPTVGCFFALYEQFRRILQDALGLGGEVLGELPADLPVELPEMADLLDAATTLPVGEAVGGVVGPVLDVVGPVLDAVL
jgi:hypothetical protein